MWRKLGLPRRAEMSDRGQLVGVSVHCNCEVAKDTHLVPAIRQGAGAPPRCLLLPTERAGAGSSLVLLLASLSAEAIGLGHLSPRLVAKRCPGMPGMKVDC